MKNTKSNNKVFTSSANFIKMVVRGRCWPSIGTKCAVTTAGKPALSKTPCTTMSHFSNLNHWITRIIKTNYINILHAHPDNPSNKCPTVECSHIFWNGNKPSEIKEQGTNRNKLSTSSDNGCKSSSQHSQQQTGNKHTGLLEVPSH